MGVWKSFAGGAESATQTLFRQGGQPTTIIYDLAEEQGADEFFGGVDASTRGARTTIG